METKTHRVYYNKDGRPTYFERQINNIFWCTHGNWEAKAVDNTLEFPNGDKLDYVRYEDLTKEEHDEALYGT